MSTPEKDRTPAQKKLAKGLESSMRITWEEVAEAVAANPADHARRERLKREVYEIERTLPRPPAHAMALIDKKSKVTDSFVLRRGDYKMRGPKVAPRPPGVILASQSAGSFPASIEGKGDKTGPPGCAREMAGRSRQSHDRPGHRQPALAVPLRPRYRGDVERLRRPRRAAVASRAARLACIRTGRRRLAAEAAPSFDGDIGDLSPVESSRRRSWRPMTPRIRSLAG